MKTTEDPRFLAHKRRVEAERREKAIERRRQETLRAITPGTATPLSIREAGWARQDKKYGER